MSVEPKFQDLALAPPSKRFGFGFSHPELHGLWLHSPGYNSYQLVHACMFLNKDDQCPAPCIFWMYCKNAGTLKFEMNMDVGHADHHLILQVMICWIMTWQIALP